MEDPSTHIIVRGANIHNLNKVNVAIPKNQFVVVTGVSGSGKSSLTMDTIYAEGQRRYVESLSAYARQFLERMDKPDVEYIKGLAPAIAIEQRVAMRTTRSTVGTLTELYDYLRLLYAKVGETFSPVSGNKVVSHDVRDVIDYLKSLETGRKIQVLAPVNHAENLKKAAEIFLQKGFLRFQIDGKTVRIEDFSEEKKSLPDEKKPEVYLLVDRLVTGNDTETMDRAADSANIAFEEGRNECIIDAGDGEIRHFSRRFELDGIRFEVPTPHFFNFNSPYGACPVCEGFGTIIGIDEDLVIPDRSLSVYEGAVAPWKGEKMSWYLEEFVRKAHLFDFPVHTAIADLTDDQYRTLWEGNRHTTGIHDFFREIEEQTYKIQYRVMLSRYRGRTNCTACRGTRLRKETDYVRIGGKPIGELLIMPVSDLLDFINATDLDGYRKQIADRILVEVRQRLQFLVDMGLGYLNLNRVSNSLSGGETQRIHLTRTLGSNLTSSIYILDEPSIGLHPHDSARLIAVLRHLRNLGNTVIVVEHEEDIIRAADFLIDVGPEAGSLGGNIVFAGKMEDVFQSPVSLTTKYLEGSLSIPVPETRRKPYDFIFVRGARQFNLQNINVRLPLEAFTVVTGISGSGKTTLIRHILYPALKNALEGHGGKPGHFLGLEGAVGRLNRVELVDQDPIGRSSRSNPVTYIKAYDAIRDLFSRQSLAKVRGYKPKHFSFNVDGGRCDHCKGEGETLVEMQFLADIHLPCEVCKGKRFKAEVLEVTYRGKNIADVLDMTIDDALEFFGGEKDIRNRLQPLSEVGLGYVHLGQSSSTLSGGEAQRVKLASFLSRGGASGSVCFIFDEPTTGLHFHDIHKLLKAFNALLEKGHTVIVIEHNLDVIKCADWIVDLGPGGGNEGGRLLYEGPPEGLADVPGSLTGIYLKDKL